MIKTIASIQDIVLTPGDHIVVERRYDKAETIHVVRVPYVGEKGFYRQGISIDSFRNRESNIWYEKFYLKNISCPRHWSVIRHGELGKTIPLHHHWLYEPQNANAPIVEHDTVWQFYKYVGYDYKTQKYAKVTENA